MNQNKSILLPGSFFSRNLKEKIEILSNKSINAIYFYDHKVHPVDESLSVYKIPQDIIYLNKALNEKFKLGLCVVNLNLRSVEDLFKNVLDPISLMPNFSLGVGFGDSRYSNQNLFMNDSEFIIQKIINNYEFKNIFIGGNSSKVIEIANNFELGMNQWLGTNQQFQNKVLNYQNYSSPRGVLSKCINYNSEKEIKSSYETIFIIKDVNLKIFNETIDSIF